MENVRLEKQTISTLISLLTIEEMIEIGENLSKEEKQLLTAIYQNRMITNWDAIHPCEEKICDIIIRRLDELNFKKDSEFYNGIGMIRSKWNSLVNGHTKTFRDKNIIWQIVFFLKFDEFTAMHLFHLNGDAIPPNFDNIDIFLFKELHKKNYDIGKINAVLSNNEEFKKSKLVLYGRKNDNDKVESDLTNQIADEADIVTVSEKMLSAIISSLEYERLVEIKGLVTDKDVRTIMQMKNASVRTNWNNKKPIAVNIKDIIMEQLKKQNITKEELIADFGKLESRNLENLLNGDTKKLKSKRELWKIIILLRFDEFTAVHLFHLNGNPTPPNFDEVDITLFRTIHENVYNKKSVNKRLAEIDEILFESPDYTLT